ncbi:SDR family NAD(P)-dependent oxidoreductase [Luteibaculum oceani]|uniref:SDR family oxidoreductase n=1 Tax=Luteibaculum oceani TaxID=1294296 RepID=A0A5C6UYA6_9FLAO|nr:SDR family oxidoreductase [Luteibaculum oceani]TXC78483.1 SDR family oxidoreductase [Luteibaculum oceani]
MYIVLGASRGIGYALVKELLRKGQSVFALSRSLEPLNALNEGGGKLLLKALDVSREDSVEEFFEEIGKEELLKVRGIIYCAGLLVNKSFTELTLADWTKVYATNVFGPASFCKQFIIRSGVRERVNHLFIGSMGGFQGASKFPGLSAYSSSKAAIACMSDCLAEEYKEGGHTFNTLSIGAVQTEMLEQAFPGYEAPVSPEEMAEFIADLVCRQKLLINGKNIPVSLSTP